MNLSGSQQKKTTGVSIKLVSYLFNECITKTKIHCQLVICNSVLEHCFYLQGSDPKKQKTEPVLVQRKGAVASAFNDEVNFKSVLNGVTFNMEGLLLQCKLLWV